MEDTKTSYDSCIYYDLDSKFYGHFQQSNSDVGEGTGIKLWHWNRIWPVGTDSADSVKINFRSVQRTVRTNQKMVTTIQWLGFADTTMGTNCGVDQKEIEEFGHALLEYL